MKTLIKRFTPSFLLSWYHFTLSFLGALLYRFPSKKIKVIAVTGTNGKTTVVNLTTRVLEKAGYKVACLSSIRWKVGREERETLSKMTMPGRFMLQKFIREAVNKGCQYIILEATSEGIAQHRHRFIKFEAAVFTNLTPEHIESHGSFENYRAAKGKLFEAVKKIHVINMDDDNSDYFMGFQAEKKYTYGLKQGDLKNSDLQLKLKLLGDFNIYNALATLAIAQSQGIRIEIAKPVVENIEGVPGRMEEVVSEPFKVFVDFALTPSALEQVYKTLKPKTGKLIAVLGSCGGGRDKWKRPVLGEIALKYAEKVIVTNEDPYDEDPSEIIDQIAEGAKGKAEKILDRREAIRKALSVAKTGDMVVITGKGCESWMVLAKGKKIPWDDRKVVREEVAKLQS